MGRSVVAAAPASTPAQSASARATRSDRWSLHDRALRSLLRRLDPDPGIAGERYEQLRRGLLKIFDWRGALEPDICADETIDRLARKIDSGVEIGDVTAFAYGVARLVLFEQNRRPEARQVSLDEAIQVPGRAADRSDRDDERLSCLERCLEELEAGARSLILRYYDQERRRRIDDRAALAGELGLSSNALRSRAHRIRDRLERCANTRAAQAFARHTCVPCDSTGVATASPRLHSRVHAG